MTRVSLLLLLLLAIAGCGNSVGGDAADAHAETAADTSNDVALDSMDVLAQDALDASDAGACPAFPGVATAMGADGGTAPADIAEATRACSIASVCFGTTTSSCIDAYVQARAGSVSIANLATLGNLVGTISDNVSLLATLLASSRTCLATATSCDAALTCLGAMPTPSTIAASDESGCAGSSLLVHFTTSCGTDGVVPIDCAPLGLSCLNSDVGLYMCAQDACPSATTMSQCNQTADYRECIGNGRVSGNCTGAPWLVSPTCWLDTDDNDVQCASGSGCDHEYADCNGDIAESCVFRTDATPNYVFTQIDCTRMGTGLHCAAIPGSSPSAFGCLASDQCAPDTVTCAGNVETVCAYGVPVNLDCAALGGRCTTNGCVPGM